MRGAVGTVVGTWNVVGGVGGKGTDGNTITYLLHEDGNRRRNYAIITETSSVHVATRRVHVWKHRRSLTAKNELLYTHLATVLSSFHERSLSRKKHNLPVFLS